MTDLLKFAAMRYLAWSRQFVIDPELQPCLADDAKHVRLSYSAHDYTPAPLRGNAKLLSRLVAP